jgi:2'-5' RNA ligase
VFEAILLPEPVRADLAAELDEVSRAVSTEARPWVPSGNTHITLAFYGGVGPARLTRIEDCLGQFAAGAATFDLGVVGTGHFGPDVTWMGPDGGTDRIVSLMLGAGPGGKSRDDALKHCRMEVPEA